MSFAFGMKPPPGLGVACVFFCRFEQNTRDLTFRCHLLSSGRHAVSHADEHNAGSRPETRRSAPLTNCQTTSTANDKECLHDHRMRHRAAYEEHIRITQVRHRHVRRSPQSASRPVVQSSSRPAPKSCAVCVSRQGASPTRRLCHGRCELSVLLRSLRSGKASTPPKDSEGPSSNDTSSPPASPCLKRAPAVRVWPIPSSRDGPRNVNVAVLLLDVRKCGAITQPTADIISEGSHPAGASIPRSMHCWTALSSDNICPSSCRIVSRRCEGPLLEHRQRT
jgi:hypothetical protein